MQIVMIKLVSIDFLVDEDLHTLAYCRDVESWLKQWTVANNFTPICYAFESVLPNDCATLSGTKAEIAPLVNAAKDTLVAQHIATLRRVLSAHTKIDRDYREDFQFRFEVCIGEQGKSMKYVPFA